MFWTIANGRYQIIGEHALTIFRIFFLTSSTVTLLVNIFVEGVMMKENPNIF